MNIFVTVGTTRFDRLFTILNDIIRPDWTVVAQTANSELTFHNIQCFDFTNDLSCYIDAADLIVSHAGAGSVFGLLEQRKKLLVVPNLERQDKHQLDLAHHIKNKGYALVCLDVNNIEQYILSSDSFIPLAYEKVDFFKGEEIINLIRSSLRSN